MMAARAVGIELDLILTNIMEGQHKTPEFLKVTKVLEIISDNMSI